MPSTTKVPLKYLFSCRYNDGTWFIQNEEDTSKTDPERSAFYDVKLDDIDEFHLFEDRSNRLPVAWVNLNTGDMQPRKDEGVSYDFAPGPKPYKLIFWRQHTHNFNVDFEEQSHTVKYILGYTDADGIEHKIYVE